MNRTYFGLLGAPGKELASSVYCHVVALFASSQGCSQVQPRAECLLLLVCGFGTYSRL